MDSGTRGKAFLAKVYPYNLRPVVIIIGAIGGMWTLFSAIGFFRNAGIEGDNNSAKLKTIAIVLGALFMVVAVIEAFGILAGVMRKPKPVGVFAILSGLAVLIVFTAELMTVVVHFVLKKDILSVCTNINNGQTVTYFGFFGPIVSNKITPQEAARWCNNSYDHDSWSLIVSMLIASVLAVMAALVAFRYYRQLLDPSSPAYAQGAAAPQATVVTLQYGAPYDGSQNYGFRPPQPYPGQAYAPPVGPPPPRVLQNPFDPQSEPRPPMYMSGDGNAYGSDNKDPFADPNVEARSDRRGF
ncbi:hypothetical protein BDQ17DRAFT_1327403 [Cyathus striatus]|nr:hypothetical protein BDQ17DRAFT_1327403 [Cyathus striatus]